ncbi:MAG: hypothetical protein U5M53_04720 [Rhodoferax sp.]|nr:hypothetical protein [Rhodoferax sp.]
MSAVAAFTSSAGIRRVLWLDAITGAGSALLSLAAPDWVSATLGLPVAVVQGSAWAVLVFVGFIAWLLAQRPLPLRGVRLLAIGNAVWVLASGELLLAGVGLTVLGVVYLVGQAALVAVLAALQWQASRAQTL